MFSCLMLLCLAIPVLAQDPNRGAAQLTIKGKKVSINYGRPTLQGRDVLSLASVGTVWRLGMDQATEIETTGRLTVAGKQLAPGKYSLWAKKVSDNSWVLAFHPKTGIWGAPAIITGYVAELPLKLQTAADSAEQLTISLAQNRGQALIKIQWGKSLLSGSFGVS